MSMPFFRQGHPSKSGHMLLLRPLSPIHLFVNGTNWYYVSRTMSEKEYSREKKSRRRDVMVLNNTVCDDAMTREKTPSTP